MNGDLEALREVRSSDEPEAGEPFALENRWLLKATLEGDMLQARLGSMVAYRGELGFERAKVGWRRLFKRTFTREGGRLMKVSGTGEVFLAHVGQQVYRVRLEEEEITCNARNLLAFESGIEWDVHRIKGGLAGKVAGGLFNTYLRGSGWVALVSDGQPVLLSASDGSTFTDPKAAIAWSGGLETFFKTDVQVRTLIGLGSGESIQMGFRGDGWVLVQPSEGHAAGASSSSGGGGAGALADILSPG